jgi:Domain of unknown function (DUF397)
VGTTRNLAHAKWRKSSYSGGNGQCVEVAALDENTIALRNSNHPDAGTVFFTAAQIGAFVKGAKDGEFDDLGSS